MMPTSKEKIEVLRRVRVIVEQQRSNLCWALGQIERHNRDLRWIAVELRQYVYAQLQPHYSLDGWQRINNIQGNGYVEDRLAWIDWMIAQLLEGE